ncbi:MAG: hypothetical protein ACYCVG_04425 [Leptospirillum sp.]
MTTKNPADPRDFDHILQTTLQGWKVISNSIPLVRKDLPGAPGEWCFSPREEDSAGIRTLISHWDKMEESLLPILSSANPLLGGEMRELLRIVRAKILFNERNHHFVGYALANDPTGQGSRSRFIESMERTIAHIEKRLQEAFPTLSEPNDKRPST